MNGFSIHDRLNYFGQKTGSGVLEQKPVNGLQSGGSIYVGQGAQTKTDVPYGMIDTRKRSGDGEGGQLGTPFYAEFFIDDDNNAADIVLEVQGGYIPDSSKTARDQFDPLDADGVVITPPDVNANWKTIGSVIIPAGLYDGIFHPRVAFSDTKFKHFRCKATVDSGVIVQAYLHKGVE